MVKTACGYLCDPSSPIPASDSKAGGGPHTHTCTHAHMHTVLLLRQVLVEIDSRISRQTVDDYMLSICKLDGERTCFHGKV